MSVVVIRRRTATAQGEQVVVHFEPHAAARGWRVLRAQLCYSDEEQQNRNYGYGAITVQRDPHKRRLQLDTTEKQVVRPLIGEPVLSQYRRDLAPMTNVVQEDVRRDFVLAG